MQQSLEDVPSLAGLLSPGQAPAVLDGVWELVLREQASAVVEPLELMQALISPPDASAAVPSSQPAAAGVASGGEGRCTASACSELLRTWWPAAC